jgi:ParB family chromosome partitioning protein
MALITKDKPTRRQKHKEAKTGNQDTPNTETSEGASVISVTMINTNRLLPFPNHKFKPYEGQRFEDMVESIRFNGLFNPIIVRLVDDGMYEILSGHNRVNAAKEAGLDTIPAVIREGLTEEDALLIVTESNILQRSVADMAHSELAYALATHYSAMKLKSGYRSDLVDEIEGITSSPMEKRSGTMDKLGEKFGLKKETVYRYIRIDMLSDALKERLDNGDIPIRAAVSLSFLRPEEQKIVDGLLKNKVRIGIQQADKLKRESQKGKLNKAQIQEILKPGKTTTKVKPVTLKSDMLSKFFNSEHESKEIEDEILRALEFYREHNKTTENMVD